VKETSETVHSIPKETCQKMTWFDEPYKTACFWGVKEKSKGGNVSELRWCKFVEYFHVFPPSYLRRRMGPAVPKETSKRWTGRKFLGKYSFKPTKTHVIKKFAPIPVVKQKHLAGNTVVNSYLKIRNNSDGNFTPKITFFRRWKKFQEIGIVRKSQGTT